MLKLLGQLLCGKLYILMYVHRPSKRADSLYYLDPVQHQSLVECLPTFPLSIRSCRQFEIPILSSAQATPCFAGAWLASVRSLLRHADTCTIALVAALMYIILERLSDHHVHPKVCARRFRAANSCVIIFSGARRPLNSNNIMLQRLFMEGLQHTYYR